MSSRSRREPSSDAPRRRAFFGKIVDECRAMGQELRGRPQLRLEDLGKLPDEKLGQVMPMVRPDYEVRIEDGAEVTARQRESGAVIRLFPLDSYKTAIFNMFDGMTPLAEIGRRLAASPDLEEDAAFSRAKRLFIALVDKGVCVPSNPVW